MDDIAAYMQEFDRAIRKARAELGTDVTRDESTGFRTRFAAFSFYRPATDPRHPTFRRLDHKREEAILWKHLNKTLAAVLRADEDIGACYAGFATLFTLDQFQGVRSPNRGSTLVLDAPLDSPGFRRLELSAAQFAAPSDLRPVPLTAVCLNSTSEKAFNTVPFVFHWARSRGHRIATDEIVQKLQSWCHVSVIGDIPYNTDDLADHQTGIRVDVKACGFDEGTVSVLHMPSGMRRGELVKRLRAYTSDHTSTDEALLKRLAWTVTYFAYACECLRMAEQQPGQRRLDHLAIVCAPASSEQEASVALYVPMSYPEHDHGHKVFARAALNALFLARTVAAPLVNLKSLRVQRDKGARAAYMAVFDNITHELSKINDALMNGWLVPFPKLASKVGGIHIEPQVIAASSKWKVMVTPELYSALSNKYVLWTGKNFLSRIGMAESDQMDLCEVMRRLIELIAGSHVAIQAYLEPVTADRLCDLTFQNRVVTSFAALRNAAFEQFWSVARIDEGYTFQYNSETIKCALYFARAISAAVTNVLEKDQLVTQFSVHVEKSARAKRIALTVRIINDCPNSLSYVTKEVGTKGVLKFLMASVKGRLTKFGVEDCEGVSRKWVTEFKMPAPFIHGGPQ